MMLVRDVLTVRELRANPDIKQMGKWLWYDPVADVYYTPRPETEEEYYEQMAWLEEEEGQ